jgi:hypothetical protein
VITDLGAHPWLQFVCRLAGVVCIRPKPLTDLARWIGDARIWMLRAFTRCGAPKAMGMGRFGP